MNEKKKEEKEIEIKKKEGRKERKKRRKKRTGKLTIKCIFRVFTGIHSYCYYSFLSHDSMRSKMGRSEEKLRRKWGGGDFLASTSILKAAVRYLDYWVGLRIIIFFSKRCLDGILSRLLKDGFLGFKNKTQFTSGLKWYTDTSRRN